jgi:FtsZ-binding cell division protein ZapB
MLTNGQKRGLINLTDSDEPNVRVFRKRILDKTERAIEDLTLVFRYEDLLPDLRRRITPDMLQNLVDSYFCAFKIATKFSNPETVIKLLDEISVLQRKNASLTQEMGDMIHQVEHFKYLATHTTNLLEMERAKPEECVARM